MLLHLLNQSCKKAKPNKEAKLTQNTRAVLWISQMMYGLFKRAKL